MLVSILSQLESRARTLANQSEGHLAVDAEKIPDTPKDEQIENFHLWSGMADVGDSLFAAAKPLVPARLLKESKCELLMSTAPVVVVGEYRLRPLDAYFLQMGSLVPLPANPSGPDACGIELSLMFCRGYPQAFPGREPIRSNPHLVIEFSIWGWRERLALLSLLADHRRLIARLLAVRGLQVTTATGVVESRSGRVGAAFECLSRYAEVAIDGENNISIGREFPADATQEELLEALVPLSILWDACYGYCKPRKAKDRLFAYAASLVTQAGSRVADI
ncbi:hypothetical protein J2W23_004856 [Variovorax boronicumulans]|uniref:hypothetical protein n=1 Tax=Variovorax boronicumulans TaxID=436515 RepID=UPI00278952DA|nr:hypothetical protein [Variovorax boronicumulans]MDQ0016453.1 hypothetical protein [Variovorax boronicumulans]